MAERTPRRAVAARTVHTRVGRRLVALAGVFVLLVLTGCTGSGAGPTDTTGTPSGPASPSASPSPSQPASPSPSGPPETTGELLWRANFSQADDFEKFEVQRSGDHFLVRNKTTLWAMTEQGKELWTYEPPEPDDPDTDELTLDVVGDLAVVTFDKPQDDAWPARKQFRVLDVASGEIVWKDDDVAFHTVVGDTVYTTRCNGKQDGGQDNCQVTRRDVRTGESDWTAPTQASARVKAASGTHDADDPQFLLLTVFPNGYEDQTFRTLDPRTAQYFGAELQAHHAIRTATDTLVDAGPGDDDSADGCSDEVIGFDLKTGAERWRHTWKAHPDGEYCDSVLGDAQHGDVLAARDAQGRPFLLDLRTGKSRWHGEQEGTVRWLDARRVLVSERSGEGQFRMLERSSDTEHWTIPRTEMEGESEVRGDRLISYSGSGDAVAADQGAGVRGFDLDSGAATYRVPGALVGGGGDGWVATIMESDKSTEATIRVFTEP